MTNPVSATANSRWCAVDREFNRDPASVRTKSGSFFLPSCTWKEASLLFLRITLYINERAVLLPTYPLIYSIIRTAQSASICGCRDINLNPCSCIPSHPIASCGSPKESRSSSSSPPPRCRQCSKPTLEVVNHRHGSLGSFWSTRPYRTNSRVDHTAITD